MLEVASIAALVVVAGIVLGTLLLERWLRGPGLDRLRAELARALRAPARDIDLELEAPRLLPVVLGRRETRARIVARQVPIGDEDARLRDLVVHLHGVRGRGGVRPDGLLLDGGRFETTLEERELPALLPLRGVVTRVEVRADGLRLWTVAAVPIEADVFVAGQELLIQPDPAQLSKLLELPGLRSARRFVPEAKLRVPVPELPLDASVREVGFEAGLVRIRGTIPPQDLRRDGGRIRARRAGGPMDVTPAP